MSLKYIPKLQIIAYYKCSARKIILSQHRKPTLQWFFFSPTETVASPDNRIGDITLRKSLSEFISIVELKWNFFFLFYNYCDLDFNNREAKNVFVFTTMRFWFFILSENHYSIEHPTVLVEMHSNLTHGSSWVVFDAGKGTNWVYFNKSYALSVDLDENRKKKKKIRNFKTRLTEQCLESPGNVFHLQCLQMWI